MASEADETFAKLDGLMRQMTSSPLDEQLLTHAKQLLMLYKIEVRELTDELLQAVHARRVRGFQDQLRRLFEQCSSLQVNRSSCFDSLPLDAIRTVCTRLPARDLARLCKVCRAASLCCDRAFRSERAASSGLETYLVGDVSLEVLACHDMLGASLSPLSPSLDPPEYTAQVGFEFGGTMVDTNEGKESHVPHSRRRIRAIGHVMQRHPAARCVIETHVGFGAPPGVAISHCVARGAVIAAFLVWYHNIEVERISVRAWGKHVTKYARRSTHPNGDCARGGCGWGELFVELNGTTMPCRPDYYGHGVGCGSELGGAGDEGVLASRVGDAMVTLRAATRGEMRPPAALPSPRSQDDEDDDEDDEEDDEEDEDEDEDDEEESVGEEAEEEQETSSGATEGP